MTTKKQIEQFMAAKPIAMAGVSRNPKKFGYETFFDLRNKGIDLIPVNPNAEEINGIKAYKSVKELPNGIASLVVMTSKKETPDVVRQALEKGIKNIWIQQMSESPEVMKMLENSDANVITNQCIRMYHNPSGIHKFHFNLKKFFGRLPN